MKLKNDIWVFLGIYTLVALFAVIFVIFPDYDWFNYKFYNSWAFLTDRMATDFLPANFRTCFNPLIELPTYFAVLKLNNHPYLFIILTLLDTAFFLFLVYKISSFFVDKLLKWRPISTFKFSKILIFSAKIFPVIYTVFSPAMLQQMSFDQNDVKIGIIVLSGFCILLKYLFLPAEKKRNLFILLAGMLVGLAVGLKLTACIYAISFCLIMLIFTKKIDKPFKTIGLFILGIVPTFLAVDGFWLIKCYNVYHNPFFPYFNNIFKSMYAQSTDVLSQDYAHLHPHSIFEFIFYPFYPCCIDRMYGNDMYSWDSRYAINFIAVVCFSLCSIATKYSGKLKNYCSDIINSEHFCFLFLFSIVPYYVNLMIFGTYRYVLSSSAIYGIVIFSLIYILCSASKRKWIFICTFCAIMGSYTYLTDDVGNVELVAAYEGNKTYGYSKVFEVKDLNFEDNSYVVFLNQCVSVVVVGQNPNVKFIGSEMPVEVFNRNLETIKNIDYWHNSKFLKSSYAEKLVSDIFASDKKVYVLYQNDEEHRIMLEDGLPYLNKTRKLENCEDVMFKIFNSRYWATDITKCEFNKK